MSAAAQAAFLLSLLAVVVRFSAHAYLTWRQVAAVSTSRKAVPFGLAGSIALPEHQKSCSYTTAKCALSAAEQAVDAVALVILLAGGLTLLGGWIRPEEGILQSAVFVGAVLLVGTLVDLPFGVYRQLRLEKRYGFGRMTPALLVADRLKGLAVAMAFGIPLLFGILWAIKAAGQFWWLLAWTLLAAANLLSVVVFPTLVAPLFNKFTPLPDGELKERALALLHRCGFATAGLYVADGSRRSRHSNAYFTGFGRAKRIVLFDTLLNALDDDEIAAVLAHELGHYKLRHIVVRVAWLLAASLALFSLLGWLHGTAWLYEAFGLEPSGGAALALALLLVPAFGFPLAPLFTALSRRHEFEADAFAADLEGAKAIESALVKLYRDNAAPLATDALYSKFFDSHPPAGIRLARLKERAAA